MIKGKLIIIAMFCALALVGCATARQAVDDYQSGATAPLQTTVNPTTGETVVEQSPRASVQPIIDIVSGIPVVGGYAPLLGGLLAAFATWKRGRRIRKGKAVSPNPITGHWGQSIGIESLVQNLSQIITGAFEVGADGSGLKRGWKVGLSTALSLGAGAVMIPAVQDFIIKTPSIAAAIIGLSALFGGLEKEVSKVLPLPPKPV